MGADFPYLDLRGLPLSSSPRPGKTFLHAVRSVSASAMRPD